MAKSVYNSETIALEDGTEVTLKPLAIGLLRKFQTAWAASSELEDDADNFVIYVNCCGIALSKSLLTKFEKPVVGDDGELSDEYRAYLEDVLDMDTVFRVFKVCAGIDFNDPKLQEAVQNALDQVGQN